VLEFSILRTSRTRVGENLTYRGGDPRALVTIAYVAILVKHERGTFLFDTGLGDRVDQQYARDMPVWKRPLLRYGAVDSARSQLERAGFGAVERIVLSHGHWDHASGLVDFPEAEVWTTPGEREFLFAYRPPWSLQRGAVMPSQIADPAIKWKLFEFIDGPYGGFEASLDLFGDRSAVLVPLPGHTPGSTGLFLTTTSGRRVLFCGDAVWNSGAIACRAPRTAFASRIADADRPAALRAVERLHRIALDDRELTIVPAHDGDLHERLGHFPSWIS